MGLIIIEYSDGSKKTVKEFSLVNDLPNDE